MTRASRVELADPSDLERRRDEAEEAEPAPNALGWITDGELLMFVERLTPVQRQVLVMRYMLDLSIREIASVLDSNPGAIRAIEHRATRTLEGRLRAVGRCSSQSGPPVRMHRWRKQAPVLRARRFALR